MTDANAYTCAQCQGTFTRPKGWTDEDANAEALAVFGENRLTTPSMAIVCDDCYEAMNEVTPMQAWANERAARLLFSKGGAG